MIFDFWHSCTGWCINSSRCQDESQQNDDTLPDYQFRIKVQVRYYQLALTVVQTLCTTPLSVNDHVLSRDIQGNETLGMISSGFHRPTHSRHTHLTSSVQGYLCPGTFHDDLLYCHISNHRF